MATIKRYKREDNYERWNSFVLESRNGTFIQLRDYMDYHSSRFTDFSLMAYDSKNNLIALLPANIDGDILYSHAGLTYGGWITSVKGVGCRVMLDIFEAMISFARNAGISKIIYKPIPHIYHKVPAEEDIYALSIFGATIATTSVASVIDFREPVTFNENARRGSSYAIANQVKVGETTDYQAFWSILTVNLNSRYGVNPVHSLSEIEMLHSRFPENIKLYAAYHDGRMIAGVVLYVTDIVTHVQYISASAEGKALKSLPLIFASLIDSDSGGNRRYFDFGTSNEDGGKILNEGLIQQKEGLGGRAIIYNSYQINI